MTARDSMGPYCGDDYPREGCSLAVDVQASGYVLRVYAPNGAPMESYFPRSPKALGRMIDEWASGKKPLGIALGD